MVALDCLKSWPGVMIATDMPAQTISTSGRRSRSLSLRTDAYPGNFASAIRAAAELNAAGVQIDARNHFRPSELSDTAIRQLRKMLDDLDLRVTAVRFPTRRGYDVAEGLEARIDATKAAMRLAHRLDCPTVINSAGNIPDAQTQSDAYEQMTQVIDDLGRAGTHLGAFLAVETDGQDPQILDALLSSTTDGYVAVCLNPGRLIINRHSVPAAVKTFGSRIASVSVVDGVIDLAAGRGIEVPLGQGIADFGEIVAHLQQHHYSGDFAIGRSDTTVGELRTDAQYMQTILAG